MKKTMFTVLLDNKVHQQFKDVCKANGLKMVFVISNFMKEFTERKAAK